MNQPILVQELLEFSGSGKPVLSAYLDVDPARQTKDTCRLTLKELLENLDTSAVHKDAKRVQDFLDREYDWQSKGLAIFSSAGQKLWRVLPLPFPVNTIVTIAPEPYLRPLSDLALNERLGIAVVDREHARFLVAQAGEIEEVARLWRATPRRHKQDGRDGGTMRLQHHADAQIQQNLKQAAAQAADIFKTEGCTRLMLGGQAEPVSIFRSYLPKAWEKKIDGEFAINVEATPSEVLKQVNAQIEEANRQRESDLVEQIAGAAKKRGATGALGLADTLSALNEKRVMTLVVAENFRSEGYRCENCGYLAKEELKVCPACNHKLVPVNHAIDLAIRRAIDLGATVATARGKAGVRLYKLGGVGALLRY